MSIQSATVEHPYNNAVLAKQIQWGHGTEGNALLTMLPHMNFAVTPLGQQLEAHRVAYGGEIIGGGFYSPWGISNDMICGLPPSQHNMMYTYATRYKKPTLEEELIQKLDQALVKIEERSGQFINDLNQLSVPVLRLRQWNEDYYQTHYSERTKKAFDYLCELKNKHCVALEQLDELLWKEPSINPEHPDWDEGKGLIRQISSFLELGNRYDNLKNIDPLKSNGNLIKTFIPTLTDRSWGNINLSSLQESVVYLKIAQVLQPDDFQEMVEKGVKINGISPFHEMISAFSSLEERTRANIQDPVPVTLSPDEKISLMAPSFPLIVCSTKELNWASSNIMQTTFQGPMRLGEEIDVLVTDLNHAPQCEQWLTVHKLANKVSVISYAALQEAFPIKSYKRASASSSNT